MGLLNASYLIWKHYRKKPLVCPLDHDCSVVTESRWSRMFFVRNEILGMMFYLLLLAGVFYFLYYSIENLFIYLVLFSSIGLLFSVFLVFLQAIVIKDYCFYCIISAVITLLVFLNSLLIYLV